VYEYTQIKPITLKPSMLPRKFAIKGEVVLYQYLLEITLKIFMVVAAVVATGVMLHKWEFA
jgi:hypothetical protein